MTPPHRLITDPGELAQACERLARAAAVAVDTEFKRERTYRPELCVVQLAIPGEHLLVDGIALADLEPLRRLFADPAVVIPLVVLYAVLAASMFGAFELNLPTSWQTKLSQVGGAGYGGAFAMGLVGGFTAAPCTGPFLAGILAFVAQIIFRYFLNLPTGWSTELSLICWLWMVLLGTAFALKEKDEIRFDIFLSAAGPRTRRAMAVVISAAAVALYALSLPGTWKYVTFMKVERSSYLNIRLDWLYSIFVIFVVAVILRYAWLLWQALRGEPQDENAESKEGAR